jgi:hypothetical protein
VRARTSFALAEVEWAFFAFAPLRKNSGNPVFFREHTDVKNNARLKNSSAAVLVATLLCVRAR